MIGRTRLYCDSMEVLGLGEKVAMDWQVTFDGMEGNFHQTVIRTTPEGVLPSYEVNWGEYDGPFWQAWYLSSGRKGQERCSLVFNDVASAIGYCEFHADEGRWPKFVPKDNGPDSNPLVGDDDIDALYIELGQEISDGLKFTKPDEESQTKLVEAVQARLRDANHSVPGVGKSHTGWRASPALEVRIRKAAALRGVDVKTYATQLLTKLLEAEEARKNRGF